MVLMLKRFLECTHIGISSFSAGENNPAVRFVAGRPGGT
jgi:hypothetical protein